MTKYITLFALIIIFPKFAFSQVRYSNCTDVNSMSRWYITPYIGVGKAKYGYKLSPPITAPDSNVYDYESGNPYTTLLGINILYNLNKSNLGAGVELENFVGTTNHGNYTTNLNLMYIKFYGRYEYAFYKGPFFDLGASIDIGGFVPKKIEEQTKQIGTFINTGLFYNLIITPKSSLIFSANYEYSTFDTQFKTFVSEHTAKGFKLNIGYRFWF